MNLAQFEGFNAYFTDKKNGLTYGNPYKDLVNCHSFHLGYMYANNFDRQNKFGRLN
jgi:hypothetical protein